MSVSVRYVKGREGVIEWVCVGYVKGRESRTLDMCRLFGRK